MLGFKINKVINFHPLEVVSRGSKTQLQVDTFAFKALKYLN